MNLGSIACAQSHAKALRLFLETPAPAALILEDDAELASGVPSMCQSTGWWPQGSRVISLEVPHPKKKLQGWVCGQTPSGRDLRTIVRWNFGAAAYLVDRVAARGHIRSYDRLELHTAIG